ncbi:unnamed protein product [Amoebophrya sp. A120]|nr:unnamed protein product [Amoebophrya sp. A120]|eukprot:GSA120T00015924001.1
MSDHPAHLSPDPESPLIPYTAMIYQNTNVSGHTIYHLRVMSPDGQSWDIGKRYSHFHELNETLKQKYPVQLPHFPGKRLFGNNDQAFINQRQMQLQHYLNGVLILEPDCRTLAVAEFLELVPSSDGSKLVHSDSVGGVGTGPGNPGTSNTAAAQQGASGIANAVTQGAGVTSSGPPVVRTQQNNDQQASTDQQNSNPDQPPPASPEQLSALKPSQQGMNTAAANANQNQQPPALAGYPPNPNYSPNHNLGSSISTDGTSNANKNPNDPDSDETDDQRLYAYLENSGLLQQDGDGSLYPVSATGQNSLEEALETLVNSASMRFLDLGQTPQCVDQIEINFRLQRYDHLIKTELKDLKIEVSEEMEKKWPQYCSPDSKGNGPTKKSSILDPAFAEFTKNLKPDLGIVDPGQLVAQFLTEEELDAYATGGGHKMGQAEVAM